MGVFILHLFSLYLPRLASSFLLLLLFCCCCFLLLLFLVVVVFCLFVCLFVGWLVMSESLVGEILPFFYYIHF